MGDREILEIYLNSASKNTSEPYIFFLMRHNLCSPVLLVEGVYNNRSSFGRLKMKE